MFRRLTRYLHSGDHPRQKLFPYDSNRQRHKACSVKTTPLVSIIIPARNEGATIPTVLRSLSRQDSISDCEVIVVDGESSDNTVAVAESFPFVRVMRSERGRANQMNRGAAAATAPVLWFLHADTTLPDCNTVDALVDALRDRDAEGGAFQFRLRGNDGYYRFVTSMVNFRARVFSRPFGDQGIFVRTSAFRQLGGYRELELCEDLDLILRLRRLGRFCLLPQTVETSARTWQAHGKLRVTLWHLATLGQYQWRRMTGNLPPTPAEVEQRAPASAALGDQATRRESAAPQSPEGVASPKSDPARQAT